MKRDKMKYGCGSVNETVDSIDIDLFMTSVFILLVIIGFITR